MGIGITIVGLWLLFSSEAIDEKKDLWKIVQRPGIIFGLLGAVSFAISFPLDKKAVVASSALFALVLICAGIALGNLLLYGMFRPSGVRVQFSWKENWRPLMLMPVVHTLGALLTFAALPYALAAYGSSVKRLWSFWTVLFSGKFLKEKNIGRKLLATIVMLLGIAVTLLFG